MQGPGPARPNETVLVERHAPTLRISCIPGLWGRGRDKEKKTCALFFMYSPKETLAYPSRQGFPCIRGPRGRPGKGVGDTKLAGLACLITLHASYAAFPCTYPPRRNARLVFARSALALMTFLVYAPCSFIHFRILAYSLYMHCLHPTRGTYCVCTVFIHPTYGIHCKCTVQKTFLDSLNGANSVGGGRGVHTGA